MTKAKYGIVMERSEGQYYIMRRATKKEYGAPGWAIEVAHYLKGEYDKPESWRLAKDKGSRYVTLWSDVDVDTKFPGFLEKLVSQIKINEKDKVGARK